MDCSLNNVAIFKRSRLSHFESMGGNNVYIYSNIQAPYLESVPMHYLARKDIRRIFSKIYIKVNKCIIK